MRIPELVLQLKPDMKTNLVSLDDLWRRVIRTGEVLGKFE